MASEDFENEEYKNWVRGAMGLKYLQEGLQDFVGDKVKECHEKTLEQIVQIIPARKPKLCSQCQYKQNAIKICPNNICNKFYNDIKGQHFFKGPMWKNSNPTEWCSDPWMYAKCFQTTPNQGSSADTTDAPGLLSILINNTEMWKFLACRDMKSKQSCIFQRARDVRNEILHNPKQKIDYLKLDEYLDTFMTVLQDGKCLINYNGSKTAVTKLLQLQKNQIIISPNDKAIAKKMREDALTELENAKMEAILAVEKEGDGAMANIENAKTEAFSAVKEEGDRARVFIENATTEAVSAVKEKADGAMVFIENAKTEAVSAVKDEGDGAMVFIENAKTETISAVKEEGDGAMAGIENAKTEAISDVKEEGDRVIREVKAETEVTAAKGRKLQREEEYQENKKPSLIPAEILRMDKKSIELYKSALSDGKEAVHAIRVMVVGHYGVGKTTLTKRLFGEEVDINKRKSTNGIDVHVRRCKVDIDTKAWNTKDKDQNIASASLRLVKILKGSRSDKTKRKMENSEKRTDIDKGDVGIKTKEQLKMKSETSHERADINDKTAKEQTSNSLQVETIVNEEMSSIKTPDLFQEDKEEDNFLKHLKKFIEEVQQHSAVDDESNTADVSVWDFAGQYVFYGTHQVFLSRRAVYLLVTDISKGLDDIVKDDDCFVDSKGATHWTVSEFVHFWLNSIHEFCSTGGDEDPPVLLVGTFADKVNKESQDKTFEDFVYNLRKSLQDKPTRCHLIKKEFPIDNSVIDTNIELLRKQILSTASKQAYWGELIPARWIALENVMIHLKENGLKVLVKEKLRDLNSSLPVAIETEEELELFLQFHHESGNIIYFSDNELSDSIFLDPQWLIDAFKSLITANMFCIKESNDISKKWIQFEKSAILTVDLVDTIWAKKEFSEFYEHKTLLLDYLEKLGIIAKPRQPLEHTQIAESYFVPCLIKAHPPEDLLSCQNCENKRFTSRLCFTTSSGFLPASVFNKLLAACLSKWQLSEENKEGSIFCGCGLFDLNKDHQTLYVFFFDHVIQIWVTRLSTTNHEPDLTLCSQVYDFVFDLLRNRLKLCGIKVFVRCQLSELKSKDDMFAFNEIPEKTEVRCKCSKNVHLLKDLTKHWSGDTFESTKDKIRFPQLTQAVQQSRGEFFDTHGHIVSISELEANVKASISVCKLFYPIHGGKATATGFRVGSRYVMTAAHVTNAFLPGEQYYQEKFAVFNYKEEEELKERDKYFIKDVVYSNPETDISVIELLDHYPGMPQPLTHFMPPVSDRCLHLIGHSQGNVMESNLVNKFINKDSSDIQRRLSELQEMSLRHTGNRGYDNEAPHDTVLNPKRFLFQCKFTKGASGSPGIIVIKKQNYVATVLLHGYPDWYHDPIMVSYRDKWPDHDCVQQGANLMCVKDMMKETHPELFNNIFGEQRRQEENLNVFS